MCAPKVQTQGTGWSAAEVRKELATLDTTEVQSSSLATEVCRSCVSALAHRRRIIGEFCDDFGVPKQMKAALIKKAKFVGSDLGFLS